MRTVRTVSPGYPDRACDVIAESIIDEYLKRDSTTVARLSVMGGKGAVFVAGIISTKADFDVGSVITRTAASLGVRGHVEPFVSIEPTPGAFLLEATRTSSPITVVGYATSESQEGLPSHVSLSKSIARKLEDLRNHDAEWYWLEPAFEVSVAESLNNRFDVYVNCAHGEMELSEVRERMKGALSGFVSDCAVLHVNERGPIRTNGLDQDVGSSGKGEDPYGSTVPWIGTTIGVDPSNPRKFGSWFARKLAREALLRSASKAVLVQATYLPGDVEPSFLKVRNERGEDIRSDGDENLLAYTSVRASLDPGLSTRAAQWGFAGAACVPWE